MKIKEQESADPGKITNQKEKWKETAALKI